MMQGTSGGIIVPINGADPVALSKVFVISGMPPIDPNDPNAAAMARMRPQTAVVGNVIIFSTGAGIDKFKAPSSEPRQDLLDGLAAGKDTAVQISLTPSTIKNNPFFKMITSGMMNRGAQPGQAPPVAPLAEPEWDSVTWISLAINSPPKESANSIFQCKDADSAAALAALFNKNIQQYKDDPTKRGDVSQDDFNKLLTVAKPTVAGSQVTMNLDQDTIDNVLGPMFVKTMQRHTATPPPAGGAPAQAPRHPMVVETECKRLFADPKPRMNIRGFFVAPFRRIRFLFFRDCLSLPFLH